MWIRRVGILTAGGLAPCLSAAIACLIEGYAARAPEMEMICYRHGYLGLLKGDSFPVTDAIKREVGCLLAQGGSVIGNSRVKLTNGEDCRRRGLIGAGEDPQVVASEQLARDGIDVLHTIGGDDTNAVASQLASYLHSIGHPLVVVGLPKTIDNDIFPLSRTLGASTAAEESAHFFSHVVNECTTNPRMLLIHEIMGRHCGWLTATAAMKYRHWLGQRTFLPALGLDRRRWDLHGIYIPEMAFPISREVERLSSTMDRLGNVNIFIGESAGMGAILEEMEKNGQAIPRDAFGHVKLDLINPGKWFGEQLAHRIGAEKVLVQKSGYFARSASPNGEDLALIGETARLAIESALCQKSGVVGCDGENLDRLSLVDFSRIRGGKPYNPSAPDFQKMLQEIGQSG